MESSLADRHTHEVIALQQLLPACWIGVTILQDLALRFSHPGWKESFVLSRQQQSNNLIELEEKIWELGGNTEPKTYGRNGDTMDPEDEPLEPLSLNRILLLRGINHFTHLMHIYGEVRRTLLPFDVRMLLQRQQLQIREILQQLSSIYLAYPFHRSNGLAPLSEVA